MGGVQQQYAHRGALGEYRPQGWVVQTWLQAPLGGEWHTRMNTPIFMKLWRQVIHDGMFRRTDWTVKVDADAVFLPGRLRAILLTPAHRGANDGNGMFSNNCQ